MQNKIDKIILKNEKKVTFIHQKLNEIFNDNNKVLVIYGVNEEIKVNVLKTFEDVLFSDKYIYISDCNFFSNKIECYLYSLVTNDFVPNSIISVQNKINYNKFKKCFSNSNIKIDIHYNCSSIENKIRNDKNSDEMPDLYVIGFNNLSNSELRMLNYLAKNNNINILILLENTLTVKQIEDIDDDNIKFIHCKEFLNYEYK